MVYSELVRRACSIMYDAHKDDVDKGGYPYVFHPFYLAAQMEDEESVCTALLHDVIEDHGDRYSLDGLERAGFPASVIHALRLLTHGDGVPYMDYVEALAEDPIARKVKAADLRHNMDASRLGGVRAKNMTCMCRRFTIWRRRHKKGVIYREYPDDLYPVFRSPGAGQPALHPLDDPGGRASDRDDLYGISENHLRHQPNVRQEKTELVVLRQFLQ